jgi:hypothetical protein
MQLTGIIFLTPCFFQLSVKTGRRSGLKLWDIEETVLAIRAVRNKESFEEIGFSLFYVVEHSVTYGHEILRIHSKGCEKKY